jgi:hypothetical protein
MYLLFLKDFKETRILCREFRKTQISNFMKIRPLGAKLFHAGGLTDRQTDIRILTVGFRNFANAPETTQEIYNTFKSPGIVNCN